MAISLPSEAATVGPIAVTTPSASLTKAASSKNTKVADKERAALGLEVIARTVHFVSNSTVFLLYNTQEGLSHSGKNSYAVLSLVMNSSAYSFLCATTRQRLPVEKIENHNA